MTVFQGLQLQSTLSRDGSLQLALGHIELPPPAADEVVIRVEAAPLNPSDLGLMFAGLDATAATLAPDGARLRLAVPDPVLNALDARLDEVLPVGNEGAGTVVAAGESAAAQALLGRTVATFSGGMFAQYRCVKAAQCLLLPAGVTAREGASCFVNPLTALGMVETLRREGHTALVHTAAASNLGQMLQRICLADGIPLVNIVRRQEQAELLRGIGASHVCVSGAPTFMADLIAALEQTGATLAFDAIGGGKLTNQILVAMEAALQRRAGGYQRYGSVEHKQVYVYGMLDRGKSELTRSYGMAWGVGGWLLSIFLKRIGDEAAERLRQRVAAEVTTTFASHYTHAIPLAAVLDPAEIAVYARMATGEKVLVEPHARR